MDLSIYKLKNNPFRTNPAISKNEIVWAGMKDLRERIDARIKFGINTTPSRIVLNWGRYGSGKTHAANFYTITDYIYNTFSTESKNIKVNLPRSSKDPVQAFLRALMGQLNFENILNDFNELKKIFPDDILEIIESNTHDSVISDFLKLLAGFNIDNKLLFDNIVPNKALLKEFLYGDVSKSSLGKLGIPLGLEDDEQIVNLISGIFNLITYQKKKYKCVFLWIDEFEDIDSFSKSNQDRFTSFLRQLLDKTPNNLTIFLNLTLKTFNDVQDLSVLLGEALNSRAHNHIEFSPPTSDESFKYFEELLNHQNYREADDVDSQNLYYPFNKDSISFVLDNIGVSSIRKINEIFSLIIEISLMSEQKPKVIDREYIRTIANEIPSWKNKEE